MNKLAHWLKLMELRGVKTTALLAGTGVSSRHIKRPDFKPTVTQYRAVLRKIIELSPPGIGIALGSQTSIAEEGVLGYAALSSGALRDVNALIKRSKPLVEEFTLYMDAIVKGEWHMEFTTAYPMGDVLPFVIEELFSRSKAESKAYTGVDVPFKQLHLTYPEPAYAKLYRKHFGCPVLFNQKRNVGVVERKYLALPIVFSDPAVCRLCENQCTRLLGSRHDSTSIGAVIRRRIILHPGNYPSLHEMSVALGVSATTLKRKLRDEGETYQHILDVIRREVAILFLRETQLTAKEISYRLGFSNVHNFRRAFKVWTGVNPTHFQS